jgi:hypothetical protein
VSVSPWYLRAIEQSDGQWECRFGRETLGLRPDPVSALHHLAEVATSLGGRHLFELYLHHRDGRVESRAATDPLPVRRGIA